jgi:DnaA family protein
MKQVALDIAGSPAQSFASFDAGPNAQLLEMLHDSLARLTQVRDQASEVPWVNLESVLLCGDRGSGKTHLLQACVHWARAQGLAVMHRPVGVAASGPEDSHAQTEFQPAWRLMVLDDVHLMSESEQATAFNWFVNASAPGDHTPRLMLMSSQPSVGSLSVREDLRTRMAQGLCLTLKTLDEQACRRVLTAQAHLRGLSLKPDVLDFMMSRFSRDMSNLVGWLDQLDAFSLQTQRAITIPLIKDMLNEL